MSQTKVNPAADFSYGSGTPVRAELPITAELQRGSPLVLRLDSERQTASIPLAAALAAAEGVSRRMASTMPGAAPPLPGRGRGRALPPARGRGRGFVPLVLRSHTPLRSSLSPGKLAEK